MASSMPTFDSTKQRTNHAKLFRLLLDVGSHVLREIFDRKRPPGSLHTVLSSPPVHAVLQSLRKIRVLNPFQWGKLYPANPSSVSARKFDITLLMVLLRNICGLVPPATGWNSLPPVTDITIEADIVRLQFYRNEIVGHSNDAATDDATLSRYWKDIQDTLVRLGGVEYQGAIDELRNEDMDPYFEEHYQECLRQWVMDEDGIKEELDEVKKILNDIKIPTVNEMSKRELKGTKYTRYNNMFDLKRLYV